MNDKIKDNMLDDDNSTDGQRIDLLFLGNFVHQLVNPMSGVAGTLDNIVDGTYSGQEAEQKINAARAQIEQCIHLIKNLAFFSEISSEKKLLRAPSNSGKAVLPQTIIEALQFYDQLGAKKYMKIELLDRTTQYNIRGRPEVLRQVFMNLFDNAVKYGTPNTTIKINPYIQKKTKTLRVSVENYSIGFSHADAEKIFSLGYRSKEAKDSIALSTGLGLYLCRKIMQDFFGGNVVAEHNNKSGISKFSVLFPENIWYLK